MILNHPIEKDLGEINSIDVIEQLVSLEGKFLIDAGCGSMDFTRPLAERGARVLAIDPDPIQAQINRTMEPIANLEFVETGAQKMPVEDHSVDGIFFSYSLHHVPIGDYSQVFAEVIRVLRNDGFLCVIEPTTSPLNEVMKLFHDEDIERAAAQQALVDLAIPKFHSAEKFGYHGFTQYESFDQYAKHYASRSFNTLYSDEDVYADAVREAFEFHGKPDYRFKSPKTMMFLKGIRKPAGGSEGIEP